MSYIIQTENLTHRYHGNTKVLDDVSLHIPTGSIYGFLGPNGAGKSTTMRLLTGILPEQGASVKLFGKPLQDQLPDVFSRIGSLVEQPTLYLHLNGVDNLRYIARLRNITEKKIAPALELVGLAGDGKRKVKQYSLGMKQRLAIAMSLLSEPELLLLDEPVNGLDPSGMQEIRQLLIKLNKERGVSIFVSSHLLAEIEKMCTHIGVIDKGLLKFEGTMEELSGLSQKIAIRVTLEDAPDWVTRLKADYPSISMVNNNQINIELKTRELIPAFSRDLINRGAEVYEIRVASDLEEWFIAMTS